MKNNLGIALAVFALGSNGANAGSASANLSVTATVQGACEASTNPLDFGAYIPGAGPVTGSATITIKCTPALGFKVALSAGATPGGSISQRLMSNGLQLLEYNLYTSNDLGSIWGDGTTGATRSGVASGDGVAATFTVFGQVPDSAQNLLATPGAYGDLVTVTITY